MENNKQQERTFTTAQGMAKACQEGAKHLQEWEDIRKIFAAEGTGQDGRWIDCRYCVEISDKDTGEYIREIYINVWKGRSAYNNPILKAEKY